MIDANHDREEEKLADKPHIRVPVKASVGASKPRRLR
jgi:hypothetical protein